MESYVFLLHNANGLCSMRTTTTMAAAVAISGAYFFLVFSFNHSFFFLLSLLLQLTFCTQTHGLSQLQLNGCAYFMRKITLCCRECGIFCSFFWLLFFYTVYCIQFCRPFASRCLFFFSLLPTALFCFFYSILAEFDS